MIKQIKRHFSDRSGPNPRKFIKNIRFLFKFPYFHLLRRDQCDLNLRNTRLKARIMRSQRDTIIVAKKILSFNSTFIILCFSFTLKLPKKLHVKLACRITQEILRVKRSSNKWADAEVYALINVKDETISKITTESQLPIPKNPYFLKPTDYLSGNEIRICVKHQGFVQLRKSNTKKIDVLEIKLFKREQRLGVKGPPGVNYDHYLCSMDNLPSDIPLSCRTRYLCNECRQTNSCGTDSQHDALGFATHMVFLQSLKKLHPPKSTGTYQFLVIRQLQSYDNRLNIQIDSLGSELIAKTAEKIVASEKYQEEPNFLRKEINRLGRIKSGLRNAKIEHDRLYCASSNEKSVSEVIITETKSPIIKPVLKKPVPVQKTPLRRSQTGPKLTRVGTQINALKNENSISHDKTRINFETSSTGRSSTRGTFLSESCTQTVKIVTKKGCKRRRSKSENDEVSSTSQTFVNHNQSFKTEPSNTESTEGPADATVVSKGLQTPKKRKNYELIRSALSKGLKISTLEDIFELEIEMKKLKSEMIEKLSREAPTQVESEMFSKMANFWGQN